MLDLAGFHEVNHLGRNRHHGVVAEADRDVLLFAVLVKAGGIVRGIDEGGEVCACDVGDAGPGNEAGGEDAVEVALLGALDAVGGHENRAGELGELFLLVLPGGAEVADKVLVCLECRVAVAGEHLAMRVDVDGLAFGLLEDFLKIFEVVP